MKEMFQRLVLKGHPPHPMTISTHSCVLHFFYPHLHLPPYSDVSFGRIIGSYELAWDSLGFYLFLLAQREPGSRKVIFSALLNAEGA